MKSTVLLTDLLIFFTSSILLAKELIKKEKNQLTLLILMNPTLILIDYCHFQYNSVSLGLMQYSIYFILKDRNLFASIFFVLSLNYKQMQLYHSLPIFFYLLNDCFKQIKYDLKLW
jgi:alpha-1,3-glucosyltransferase